MVDFNTWEFDYDGWTMGEDALYMQTLEYAQRTGDMRPLYSHWSRMIRHWPYALDPTDLKCYTKLDEAACREIIEQINLLMRIPKRPDGRNGGGET